MALYRKSLLTSELSEEMAGAPGIFSLYDGLLTEI